MQQDRDIKYGEASLKSRERFSSQIKTELNKNVSDAGIRFLKLINIIPNWETYLTSKQLESAKKYITTLNASEVDYQLRLTSGTSYQRLFGSNTSKGAIGKLEKVNKSLEDQGYFEEQQKQKEISKQSPKKNKLAPKTLLAVKELISLVSNNQDYEKYLTKNQAEKVYQFMKLMSFSSAADKCCISQDFLKTALLGKGSVLEKLKSSYAKRMVNTWEEI